MDGMKKGQYFSFDAVVAAVIFIIALSLLSSYWFGVRAVMDAQDDGMLREALRLSDSFLTPGTPANWETKPVWDGVNGKSNVYQVGFTNSTEGNVLSHSKLIWYQQFVMTGTGGTGAPDSVYYPISKGILRTEYDYYVNITDVNNVTLYAFGMDPVANGANNTVRVDRIAAINNSVGDMQVVGMHVMLWSPKART